MRYPLTFLSVIVLIWCSCAVLRASLPWIVSACVIAQTVYHLVGILGLQKHPPTGPAYVAFMAIGFSLVLVFNAWFALRVASFWFAMSTLNWCIYVGLLLMRHKPRFVQVIVVQAVVLLWCGLLALIALHKTMRPEMHYATLALGLYWLGTGVLFFCWSVGIHRNPKLWMLIGDLAPATLALIAFGGLAFMLWGGPQGEVTFQEIHPEPIAMEVQP